MRSALIALFSIIGVAFAYQTGDYLGPCTNDELNEETCYDTYGFEQCGDNGWIYQDCPIGTYCHNLSGGGVICD